MQVWGHDVRSGSSEALSTSLSSASLSQVALRRSARLARQSLCDVDDDSSDVVLAPEIDMQELVGLVAKLKQSVPVQDREYKVQTVGPSKVGSRCFFFLADGGL